MATIKKLNRFTSLPVLLDVLERKSLTLISPAHWSDRNDSEPLIQYENSLNKGVQKKRLFALCFTHKNETIHHWENYASQMGGCCIAFSFENLEKVLNETKGIVHGPIRYVAIPKIKTAISSSREIPFVKRLPYSVEGEYRVIWMGSTDDSSFELPIDISWIRRITFSQKMPRSVFDSVKKSLIHSYPQLKGKINYSSVYQNQQWITSMEALLNKIV